jgi:hypothetical protein
MKIAAVACDMIFHFNDGKCEWENLLLADMIYARLRWELGN